MYKLTYSTGSSANLGSLLLQWNLSITDTFGEQCFGLYTEVAFVERLFYTQTIQLGPGCLAVSNWPLFGGSC